MDHHPNDIVIGAIDVGAPKNIGWAIMSNGDTQTGNDLDEFIELFSTQAVGKSAALGFECPLFIPLHDKLQDLTKQREGEAGRPWSAGAGATVTTIGLANVTYTLSKLRNRMPGTKATLDWNNWPSSNDLLIWEAFVSGAEHAGPGEHHLDALTSVRGFKEAIGNLGANNAVQGERVLSLAEVCLLRAGWMTEWEGLLRKRCVVIKP